MQSVRKSIIEMVLFTDNKQHLELVERFKATFRDHVEDYDEDRSHDPGTLVTQKNEQQLCLNFLLHAADIGSCSKKWDV